MSVPPEQDPKRRQELDDLVEQAIAEYFVAEDQKIAFDEQAWLSRYTSVATRLLQFLEDHRRARSAWVASSIVNPESGTPQLHDTVSFSSMQPIGSVSSRSTDRSTSRMPSPLEEITQLGPYRLTRLLGSGGMGRVYEAFDAQGHPFAIKLIAGHLNSSPDSIERFRQEGIVASTINHPRCVFVHAADSFQGHPYIVMERMPGQTLRDLVQRKGPLSVEEAIEKTLEIADGLAAAHAMDVIHRDVKPSNCYLDAEGRVKVGDFGLAKSLGEDAGLTATGSIVGTPLFASPEQLKGEEVDARSDIYSLCATLYYMLVGKAPFEHSNATTVIARVLTEDVPSLSNTRGDIPMELERLIASGMNRNRDLRPRSMRLFREQLQALLPQQGQLADLGLRFAAYCIDVLILSIVFGGLTLVRPEWFSEQQESGPVFRPASHIALTLFHALYFFLWESTSKTTPGKRLFGLKVSPVKGGPSQWMMACAVRSCVWWMLNGGVSDSALHVAGVPLPVNGSEPRQWLGYAIGYALLFVPGLIRRDRRMLHDWISGTQVETFATAAEDSEDMATLNASIESETAPIKVDRFLLDKKLVEGPHGVWYSGHDPALHRRVWCLIRDPASAPLDDQRRSMTGATRLRWIASGLSEHGRWDAFLGMDAVPLKMFAHSDLCLRWPTIQQMLLSLVDDWKLCESGSSITEEDLDESLLWVGQDKRLVRLEWFHPASSTPPSDRTKSVARFLGGVAEQLRAPSLRHTREPYAWTANQMVDQWVHGNVDPKASLGDLRAMLQRWSKRSSQRAFRHRLIHITLLAALSLAPIGALGSLIGAGRLVRKDRMDEELLKHYALKVLVDDQDASASLESIAKVRASRTGARGSDDRTWVDRLPERTEQLERITAETFDAMSPLEHHAMSAGDQVSVGSELLPYLIPENRLPVGEAFTWKLGEEVPGVLVPVPWGGMPRTGNVPVTIAMRKAFQAERRFTAEALSECQERLEASSLVIPLPKAWKVWVLSLIPWFLIGLWGWGTRGGLALIISGSVIVDERGKRPAWWRRLLRSFLLWAPFGLGVSITILVDFYGLAPLWLANWMKFGCLSILFLYGLSGLFLRGRAPHDRIAGTWVVLR